MTGVALPVYLWLIGAIVAAGLLVDVALRRTLWSVAPLLISAVAAMIAFGNTQASLHHGVETDWTPSSAGALHASCRLAL
ncbi:MAG: hypothetical protein ACR2LF_12015 [Jatrophihabitantaceae bacterium]